MMTGSENEWTKRLPLVWFHICRLCFRCGGEYWRCGGWTECIAKAIDWEKESESKEVTLLNVPSKGGRPLHAGMHPECRAAHVRCHQPNTDCLEALANPKKRRGPIAKNCGCKEGRSKKKCVCPKDLVQSPDAAAAHQL